MFKQNYQLVIIRSLIIFLLFVLSLTIVIGNGKIEARGNSEPNIQKNAEGLAQVTLRTNWLWYGSHSIFFLGINKGYYAKNGIDLVVKQGNGSGSAVRLVANGDSTFAYAASAAGINLAATGAPIISVGTIDGTGVDAVMANPDSGIRKPKDLENKKILTTANSGANLFFPLFLQNSGVDISKVTLINIAESALVSSYLENLGDALLGGADDKPSEIVSNGGKAPVILYYSDHGVIQPGYSIFANRNLVAQNPDLVRRFMRATLQALSDAAQDPDAAIDALVDWAANMENNRQQAKDVLAVTLRVLYSPNNTNKVLGLNVSKDWESALGLMKKFNDLDTSMTAAEFYTNEFIDK